MSVYFVIHNIHGPTVFQGPDFDRVMVDWYRLHQYSTTRPGDYRLFVTINGERFQMVRQEESDSGDG